MKQIQKLEVRDNFISRDLSLIGTILPDGTVAVLRYRNVPPLKMHLATLPTDAEPIFWHGEQDSWILGFLISLTIHRNEISNMRLATII
jgi:hypothetical protein